MKPRMRPQLGDPRFLSLIRAALEHAAGLTTSGNFTSLRAQAPLGHQTG
jgi:hypothetical protein